MSAIESSSYFDAVASKWDEMRSAYFTEAVRKAAIAKAYLRPEMIVADIGAGTGFMTAGLTDLVREVHVIDSSTEMLDVARRNLASFDNLTFHLADGLTLPIPDSSLDAVFANMYLHHTSDPLAAIQEMIRLLRPGGRLVITDMDAHTNEWMKAEMADVWLGFQRMQLRDWYRQAGLVNVIIDSTGEDCCAASEGVDQDPQSIHEAKIGVFVASGTRRVSGARQAVQEHYAGLAVGGTGCCSSNSASESSCCGTGDLISLDDLASSVDVFEKGYTIDDRLAVPAEAADFALGCGNPVAIANLKTGETVLDVGSGGGLDAFLAAKKVGTTGKVIGVDMTPEMLERARQSAIKSGIANVEFRQGQAEGLPVELASVDVIISNCVINLTEDKGIVFNEAARALRCGGRLEISDMVTDGSFPSDFREEPDNWGSCVFGALPETEYLDLVRQAGFEIVQVRRSQAVEISKGVKLYSLTLSAQKKCNCS